MHYVATTAVALGGYVLQNVPLCFAVFIATAATSVQMPSMMLLFVSILLMLLLLLL